ncbi:tryptophan halogenase family protein [Pseudophaeobacter sp. 1A16562]|uniref:tryptophan halogenase family protein n=1 Tax=Pseudophaeobacter sp. 1A16562 TaxID=3098143 RepID=UPI0034D6D022
MKKIIVVGGGTAGWLTALTLKKFVPSSRTGPIEITVIEPSAIGRIGVGEATIPSLKQTLARLDLSERDLMRETGATFKHGIRFVDWRSGPENGGDAYFHPFERNVSGQFERFSPYHPAASTQKVFDAPVAEIAALIGQSALAADYSRFQGVQTELAERGLPPKTADMPDYDGLVQYAYHLDAEAMGDWLGRIGQRRRIRVVDAVVEAVERNEDGTIGCLQTGNGQKVEGDFFVDCTGFRSVLMRGTLKSVFKPFGNHLLCDRAVAAQLPVRSGQPRPFTTATARRHGWTWDLDLAHRRGFGQVYSSAHCSDDEAEALLRTAAGQDGDKIDVRRLRMDVGRVEDFWIGNCAAVGLASGFLEPLESTGIGFIEIGAYQLAQTLIFGQGMPAAAREYTRRMRAVFDETAEFIIMHYVLSGRRDTPFWKDATAPERLTDGLRDKLEQWRAREPNSADDNTVPRMFSFESARSVLYGMNHLPDTPRAASIAQAQALRRLVAQGTGRAVSQLSSHAAVLEAISLDEEATPPPVAATAAAGGAFHPGEGQAALFVTPDFVDRVELSAGTMPPPAAAAQDYQPDALVPDPRWRIPTPEEKTALTPEQDAPSGRLLEILTFDNRSAVPTLRAMFARPGADPLTTPASKEYAALLERLKTELSGHCEGEMRCLSVISHPAGMATVTRQGPEEPLIGLHVDSWSKTMLGERDRVPNRLCINLGSNARHLLFAPITIGEMGRLSGLPEARLHRINPTDLGRHFMRLHPSMPIMRIRIDPGEAYIAPTENVVHDGATTSAQDVTLTFLGRFRSIVAARRDAPDAPRP